MKKLILGKLASFWLTGIVAVISFGLVSTALAVPPFKYSIDPWDIQGEFVADCDEYAVLTNFTLAGHVIEFYDKDGNLERLKVHLSFLNSIYYGVYYEDINFVDGYAEPEVFLEGGPGEHNNQTAIYVDGQLTQVKYTGPTFKVTVPGYGVIFIDTGQIVLGYEDFEIPGIIFQAGQHNLFEDEVAALCAAVQPIEYENGT